MLQDRKNYLGPRLWGTTLGSPLVLRTRAETWVFPHNPRPLVFFLSHNPHLSSLCSLSCIKPKVLPKGILFSACDWWKAVNCGTVPHRLLGSCGVCDTLGLLGYASLHLEFSDVQLYKKNGPGIEWRSP